MLRPSLGLLVERYAPWAAATVAAGVTWRFSQLWLLKAEWRELMLSNVISASSILVAYLLTAATVLPAIEDKAIIQRMRALGLYDFIVDYVARAAWSAAGLLVLSLVAIPLPTLVGNVWVDRVFSAGGEPWSWQLVPKMLRAH
jgi:hypothetical protein